MSKTDQAVQRFGMAKGINCAQAIVMTYGAGQGVDEGTLLKIGSALGGGCRVGEVCGAVSGACVALGLKHGPTAAATDASPADKAARDKTYKLATQFMQRFQARHGHVRCCELLGCNISTPDGMKAAMDKKLFTTLCPEFVRSAGEILEELI